MKPSVEIIILSYNNKILSEQCLNSVLKTDYSNLKITLVDNCSSDGSYEYLNKRFGKRVYLVKNDKNLGFAEGNNVAMRKSKADYICLLNNDTTVDRYWLKNLVNFMEKNKNVGACQPKVLSLREPNKFEYAGAAGGMIDIFGYPICRGRIFDNVELDGGQYNSNFKAFWACGVAMMLRRSVLDKVGYFDKDFFMYGEEVDLSWRINLAGYDIYCIPSSTIYHLGRAAAGKKENRSKSEYLLHKNHFLILFKNYSSDTLKYVLPVKIVLETITFGAFIFRKPDISLASLRSLIWVFTHPRYLIRKHKELNKIRRVRDKKIIHGMINSSVPILHFLGGKKYFKEYIRYMPYLGKFKNE